MNQRLGILRTEITYLEGHQNHHRCLDVVHLCRLFVDKVVASVLLLSESVLNTCLNQRRQTYRTLITVAVLYLM